MCKQQKRLTSYLHKYEGKCNLCKNNSYVSGINNDNTEKIEGGG